VNSGKVRGMHDLIIVGGGPAGLTAGVYAARKKIDVLLITQDLGGQVNWTFGIENYMGYQFVEGQELMAKFEQQVKQFPIEVQLDKTVSKVNALHPGEPKPEANARGSEDSRLDSANAGFSVLTQDGEEYLARSVIFAAGKRPRPLNVPGEQELRGKGVTYCAVCDGPLFSGEEVVVVGGGNSALETGVDMAKIASRVHLVSTTPLTGDPVLADRFRAATNTIIYLEHTVAAIDGMQRVERVRIRDLGTGQETVLHVAAVFVEIGLIPNSDAVGDLATLNAQGEIRVNCRNETNVPGLFAAGDVTDVPEKQIVIAAGEGAKAALRAHHYLQRLP